ncbi:hypothetical protein V8G56_07580 [Gaetbulibacter aquiaggeris]|uniref:Carboxypeptidase regulatory-like domain-containing protein n=1 Tax=Gaetbulibacter aquiaggeris TaxID=1735373 RepID=A0ABW7MP41_9FLAO
MEIKLTVKYTLVFCIILCFSCSKDYPDTDIGNPQICSTILDGLTNNPIEGATLTITYDTGSQLGPFLTYATADVNGLACTTISSGSLLSISAYAPGYKAQNVLPPLPNTIRLFPVEE